MPSVTRETLSSLPVGAAVEMSKGTFSWQPDGDVVRFCVETKGAAAHCRLSSSEARKLALGLFNAAETIDPLKQVAWITMAASVAGRALGLSILGAGMLGLFVFVVRLAWRLGGGW